MNTHSLFSVFSLVFPKMKFKDFEQWTHHYDDFYDFKRDLPEQLGNRREDLDPKWFDNFLKIIDYYYKYNIKILDPTSEDYPQDFLNLKHRPIHLAVRGDLNVLKKVSLSCVGSRHPNKEVLEWMDAHITEIAKKGYVIVSGAARGVDQRAHACAIRVGMPTVAFLPSGLSTVYPREFQKWEDDILDSGGALISEYSPFTEVRSHHFHERNRMIANLGLLTFVAQARRKSGSTLTARLAVENSKAVAVLPFFPGNIGTQGCLDLLFQGAFPIRDSEDLICLLRAEAERKRHLFQMTFNV